MGCFYYIPKLRYEPYSFFSVLKLSNKYHFSIWLYPFCDPIKSPVEAQHHEAFNNGESDHEPPNLCTDSSVLVLVFVDPRASELRRSLHRRSQEGHSHQAEVRYRTRLRLHRHLQPRICVCFLRFHNF